MHWKQFFKDAAFYFTVYNTYRIREGVDNLNDAIRFFTEQSHSDIKNLTAIVAERLDRVTDELVLHTKILTQIRTAIENPKATEAREQKKFGLRALKNGWLDDAEKDFLESIRINRYDCEVYYLLSKISSQRGNIDMQGEYLKKAYDYAGEEEAFKEYILLDIAGLHLQLGETDVVKSIIENMSLRGEPSFVTSMMRVLLYIKLHHYTDETFENIEKAIDLYESTEPIKIMQAIEALSSLMPSEQSVKVKNILNKKQLTICKKSGLNALVYVENLKKLLYYIQKNDSFMKVVPPIVIQIVFPYYYKLDLLLSKLELAKSKLQSIVIVDYEKLLVIPQYLKNAEDTILKYYKSVLDYSHLQVAYNERPFEQQDAPILNFNIGNNDKILFQVKLDTGEYLMLTFFKFLIIYSDKETVAQFDLLDEFTEVADRRLETSVIAVNVKTKVEHLVNEIKRQGIVNGVLNNLNSVGSHLISHTSSAAITQTQAVLPNYSTKIKFFLRDTRTDQLLTINDNSSFSDKYYTKDDGLTNSYNILMTRTNYNIKYLLMLEMFNHAAIMIETTLNFFLDINADDNAIEFIDDNDNYPNSNNDEVEFLD